MTWVVVRRLDAESQCKGYERGYWDVTVLAGLPDCFVGSNRRCDVTCRPGRRRSLERPAPVDTGGEGTWKPVITLGNIVRTGSLYSDYFY